MILLSPLDSKLTQLETFLFHLLLSLIFRCRLTNSPPSPLLLPPPTESSPDSSQLTRCTLVLKAYPPTRQQATFQSGWLQLGNLNKIWWTQYQANVHSPWLLNATICSSPRYDWCLYHSVYFHLIISFCTILFLHIIALHLPSNYLIIIHANYNPSISNPLKK